MSNDQEAPWYKDGLCFTCRGPECTACCQGSGAVWLTMQEAERIAEHINIGSVEEFLREFCIGYGDRISLISKPGSGDCVFLDRKTGCAIRQVRPVGCRTFPFWRDNLLMPETWEDLAGTCPGISEDGEHHDLEMIEKAASMYDRQLEDTQLPRKMPEVLENISVPERVAAMQALVDAAAWLARHTEGRVTVQAAQALVPILMLATLSEKWQTVAGALADGVATVLEVLESMGGDEPWVENLKAVLEEYNKLKGGS